MKPDYASQICDDGIALDAADAVAASRPPRADQWQAPHRLRHLDRQRRRTEPAARPALDHALPAARRFDPPPITFDDIKLATSPPAPAIVSQPAPIATLGSRRREPGQVLAWLTVLTGALVLAGGLGLIAWSLLAERADGWNLALGLTLGGQGTLIFGLVLVVARLWRNSRYATGKLQNVHAQLIELQRTADTLAATRSASAGAFYADLARGASPQVLLANLKGQLDQLTARLGSGS